MYVYIHKYKNIKRKRKTSIKNLTLKSINVVPGSKKTGLLPDFLKCGLLEGAVARPPNIDVNR